MIEGLDDLVQGNWTCSPSTVGILEGNWTNPPAFD